MNKLEIENKVFNLALAVYIFQAVMVTSSMESKPFLGYLTYLILLLLGIKIIISKYSMKQFFLIVLLSVFGIWLYYITSAGDAVIFTWFIIAARDVELRKTFRIALAMYIFSIALGIFLYLSGFATDNIKNLADGSIGHSYGFANPNSLSLLIFQCILIWIFLRYKKLKISDYLGIILIELIVYSITKCRSALIISILLLFLIPNIKTLSMHKYSKRILSILVFISPICAMLSFSLAYLYGQGVAALYAIDVLGSSRISSAYINIVSYGMYFLPVANNPIYESLYTLDNSYVRMATHFGILVLILTLYIYTRSMYFMYKREEYERLTTIALICILSLFETNLYRLCYNIAILFLSEGLYISGKIKASYQYINNGLFPSKRAQ